MVALLDQVEVSEVKLATSNGTDSPSVEVPTIREVVIDKTCKNADDQRMAITMLLKVLLDFF